MAKLIVKNFINIREAEIDMDKTLLVLIGETATGKSVLAKLMFVFQDVIEDFRRYFKRAQNYPPEFLEKPGQDLPTVFHTQLTKKFMDFFGDTLKLPPLNEKSEDTPEQEPTDEAIKTTQPFEIVYHYTEESRVRLTCTPEGELQIEIPAVLDEVQDIGYESLEELRPFNLLKTKRSLINAWPRPIKDRELSKEEEDAAHERFYYILQMAVTMNTITEKLGGTHRECLYIPADRNIAATYPDALKRIFYGGIKTKLHTRPVDLSRSNLILMASYLEKNEELLELFEGKDFENYFQERLEEEGDNIDRPTMEFLLKKFAIILNGDSEVTDSGRHPLLFPYLTDKNLVDLENASTGQQTLTRILQDMIICLIYHDTVFRVIEEPEASLHPTTQKYFMQAIAITQNTVKSQLVMITHSPYILAALKKHLTAGRLAKKSPEAAEEKTGLPELCWLKHEDVEVYHLKDGKTHPLVRPKNKSILPNPLADLLRDF